MNNYYVRYRFKFHFKKFICLKKRYFFLLHSNFLFINKNKNGFPIIEYFLKHFIFVVKYVLSIFVSTNLVFKPGNIYLLVFNISKFMLNKS